MESYLIYFMTLFQWMSYTFAESDDNNNESHLSLESPVPVGNYCWGKICGENQFCNDLYICQCLDGYISFNGYCIPCVGENEHCSYTEDCCGMLLCINGLCRKKPQIEFATLAKICLAITATTVMVAVFSCLMKCMIRYSRFQRFRREDDNRSVNSFQTYMRQFMNRGNHPEPEQEKPPSYEECIRSLPRTPCTEPPPPYSVTVNIPASPKISANAINDTSMFNTTNSQNVSGISLNPQCLESSITADPKQTPHSQKAQENVSATSSSNQPSHASDAT